MASKTVETNRELFEYTSGRWIYNESLRLPERALVFSVRELKRVAAASIHRHETDIKSFKKLAEGGFNRVFEITMKDDGAKVLARLPYPSTVPKRLTVASEVATLDLIRSHDIPVPKVLDYSTNPDNPVGAEYIIMEKINGDPIGESWYTLSDKQRLKVLKGLVQLEAKLFAIDLPASGSLYYSHDLPPEMKGIIIRPSQDSDVTARRGEICVGPITSLKWWYGERRLLCNINRGPHLDATESLTAIAEKELAWLQSYGKPRFPFERAYREATNYRKSVPEEHMATLEKYLKIAPYLVPKDKSLHRPILRHPDLQPNNIFVSKDLDIIGLIDWQYCSALPIFLAAGIPQYIQNYDDEESLHFIPPKLPKTLDEMSAHERSTALEQFRRRHLHFYYLGFTQRFNPSHFHALDHDRSHLLKRKTFTHAGDPWEGNNIQLKADLVHMVQNWDKVVTSADAEGGGGTDAVVPPCPITFDLSEAQDTLRIEKEYEKTDSQLSLIRDAIGVSIDGWTSNEMFEDAIARAKEFKKMAIDSVSDNKIDQEMTEKHWPFDDFVEDE
ncbi:phosphotransferase enzyme family protein [Histoplasma capsulatum G186AR]|uniref:Phosphotransferase enzyme family protein n=2 Tax=Ajellomyces capsulatus TaxID=5037 RepID=C0NXN2_AJECG|nr:phosphotransferase enzyme family protein [Histoplasma capsulatum G186AR]EEH04098.1 phosphotransferase enzyme family protein [Histoplasma capsulatum G186AR]